MRRASYYILFPLIFLVNSCQHKLPAEKKNEDLNLNQKKFNLVLISIDSLRRDHLGINGYGRNTSPHIDELAKSSWLFKNYHSTGYLTPVSETSVQTGLYPDRIHSEEIKKQKLMTIGHILKKEGYFNLAFGNSPEFKILKEYRQIFEDAFNVYNIRQLRTFNNRLFFWDKISAAISHNKEKPLFLWFALGNAHAPFGYLLPNKFADESYRGPFYGLHYFANMQYYYDGQVYDPREKGKKFNLYFMDSKNSLIAEEIKGTFPKKVSSEDFKFLNDIYDNGVAQVDYEVGEIIKILKEKNLYDNSIIVLQSEHGETLGERKYIAHTDIHDEMVHTPLIIHIPQVTSKVFEDNFVSGVDIMPTILDVLNIPFSNYKLDGESFIRKESNNKITANVSRDEIYLTRVPLWETSLTVDVPNSIFDQLREYQKMSGNDLQEYAIKNKKYKLIHRRARFAEMTYSAWTYISGKKLNIPEYEFYNVIKDPKELHPIPARGKDFEKLKTKLLAFEANVRKGRIDDISKKELQDYR